jgi:hypothetical protein
MNSGLQVPLQCYMDVWVSLAGPCLMGGAVVKYEFDKSLGIGGYLRLEEL